MNNIKELPFVVSLILGDWSHDGHSQTDTVVLKSNLDKKDIQKAYAKGIKKLGFDFINEVCEEYEDSLLPKDKLDLLIKHGLTVKDLGLKTSYELDEFAEASTNENSNGLSLWINSYTDIYLFIIKLGNKDFEYKILEGDINPSIEIGGYGLYT